MPNRAPHNRQAKKRPLLLRADQAAIAMLTFASLIVIAAYVWRGSGGSLIEIDRAAPLEARYRVDINAAEWPELSQLPGVGESLARKIVSTRESNGPFADHESLRRVPGIGPRTLERMRPYLLPMADARGVAGK